MPRRSNRGISFKRVVSGEVSVAAGGHPGWTRSRDRFDRARAVEMADASFERGSVAQATDPLIGLHRDEHSVPGQVPESRQCGEVYRLVLCGGREGLSGFDELAAAREEHASLGREP